MPVKRNRRPAALVTENVRQSYYVVIVNVCSVILCILCFCILDRLRNDQPTNSACYFILWAVVSAAYPALLSSSYFERINDDDDDDDEIVLGSDMELITENCR